MEGSLRDLDFFKKSRLEPRILLTPLKKIEKILPAKVKKKATEIPKNNYSCRTVLIDAGAYSIKVGAGSADEPKIIPNCIMKAKSERKRLFIGDQIQECRDRSALYFLLPCKKGYITKWEVQKPIWDYAFTKNNCSVADKSVVMTQPIFNFGTIQDCIDEIFFEEYEVATMHRCNPTDLVALKYCTENEITSRSCIVVDSGYSFTHIVPYIEGLKYLKGVKRIDVGGKVLTNHLKDILSYRQYHVMDETYVINQVKEDSCYISQDFNTDMRIASLSGPQNTVVQNYVLPDFNSIRRGYIHDPRMNSLPDSCQVLRLNNERFGVPEVLFHPSDIGMKMAGIVEAVIASLNACPEEYHRTLIENIVIVGGNAMFPGFKQRLLTEIQSQLKFPWAVNCVIPDNPITYAWYGAKTVLQQKNVSSFFVTKAEYEENGSAITESRFNTWSPISNIKQAEVLPAKKNRSLLAHAKKVGVLERFKKPPRPTRKVQIIPLYFRTVHTNANKVSQPGPLVNLMNLIVPITSPGGATATLINNRRIEHIIMDAESLKPKEIKAPPKLKLSIVKESSNEENAGINLNTLFSGGIKTLNGFKK